MVYSVKSPQQIYNDHAGVKAIIHAMPNNSLLNKQNRKNSVCRISWILVENWLRY